MTVILKDKTQLVVPPSVQRKAGLKRSITITPVEPPANEPAKAEWAAIRKGESAIASGDAVSVAEFLHGLDSSRRKTKSQGFPLE